MADFDALHRDLRTFVAERDWEQFHDPKSLLLALTGEVGELCEVFQWVPANDAAGRAASEPMRSQVADEIADVLIYLVHLADAVGVDPVDAAASKLERNRSRFPL
jgi:dCTP diphosphatase